MHQVDLRALGAAIAVRGFDRAILARRGERGDDFVARADVAQAS
jgi:hypothetical protein